MLLRGGAGDGQRSVGGYLVMIHGEAKPEDWPTTYLPGDIEGILWTTPRQVARVVENLRACAGVVDAHSAETTASPIGRTR